MSLPLSASLVTSCMSRFTRRPLMPLGGRLSAGGDAALRLALARSARAHRHAPCDVVFIMSNASKRQEGAAEELGGKIKKGIGAVIGNEQMQAEGEAKKLEGEAKQKSAKAAERTKGAVEKVVGAVKNRVGHVIDNEQMAAEGKVKELKGEARQKANH